MNHSEGRAVRSRTALPDLAYLVHEADNDLLRYSLRSIEAHAEGLYRKVWIVGVLPEWARNVEHIPVEYQGEKFADIRAKLTALCAERKVAANVVIMNDDHIATGPVSWDAVHMGSTEKFIAEAYRPKNSWWEAMRDTAGWMRDRGHGDILCYAGHVPLMYSKRKLKALLAEYPADQRLLDVGLYPEAGTGGEGILAINSKIGPSAKDFLDKLTHPRRPGWVSTNDRGWSEGMIGGYIRGMYPHPSKYEAT